MEVLFLNSWGVVLELGDALLPIQEKNSLFTIRCQLMRVIGVEFDPVLVLELLSVFILQRNNRSILFLVSPVPQRNGLWLVITQRGQVSVISRQIQAPNTIWVRIQESSDWRSGNGVPNNEHRVLTAIGGDDPPFVIRAGSGCDLVAVTLEQFLRFLLVVVDDAGVRRTVEYLRPAVSR